MARDVTRDELMKELMRAIVDEPAPEGWYTARELWEFAQDEGREVTLAMVRNRLKRAVDGGRIDCKKVGLVNYYRIGVDGEV